MEIVTMKKWIVCLFLLGTVTVASADQLALVNDPYGVTGPYGMSLNSGPTGPMICFSDANEITVGESWTVQAFTIATIASAPAPFNFSATIYNEVGYLANELFLNPGNSDIQNAIWFADGTGGQSNSYLTGAVTAVVTDGYVTSDTFYIPVCAGGGTSCYLDNSDYPDGIPQPFAAVPEPASLLLLGSGLLALGGTLRRKLRF